MSTKGGTKRDLFRVIAEKDAEIARLYKLLPRPDVVDCNVGAIATRPTSEASGVRARLEGIVRGSKVRRIDEPYVVLHVREIDTEGTGNDGLPKALCFNSFGAGKWMRIDELEVLPMDDQRQWLRNKIAGDPDIENDAGNVPMPSFRQCALCGATLTNYEPGKVCNDCLRRKASS